MESNAVPSVGTLTMPSCSWVNKWRHRRLRMLDVELMWRSLYERADTVAEARVAFEVFLLQKGQDHWKCPCGKPIAELLRAITITIQE